MPTARALVPADRASLSAVAVACDQAGILSVSDDRYLEHVRARGEVQVTGPEGAVEAYGGVLDLDGAAYLTDLFVNPKLRDRGHGRTLLGALWEGRSGRVTSSSLDPRALSGYARYGALPRWPLLYLTLPGGGSPTVPVGVRDYVAGDAGWSLDLDELVTVTVASSSGEPGATAVVRRQGDLYRVLRARTPDPKGLTDLVAELRRRAGRDGAVSLVIPGPHPALPDLLMAGARVDDVDLWCAADSVADLVDPTRDLPSPALA